MKLLQLLIAVIITFLICLATTALCDIPWFAKNELRMILVGMLVAFEFIIGALVVREILKQ